MASRKKNSAYGPLVKALKEEGLKRLYVLTGEDSWLIEDVVRRIRKLALQPGLESVDEIRLDCAGKTANLDLNHLERDTSSPPFMSPRRLVIIQRSAAFQSNSFSEQQSQRFREILERLPDYTCLVFIEEKVDRRQKSLISLVEKQGVMADIMHESAATLVGWLKKILSDSGTKIGNEEAENLVDRCESDMRQIMQETDKLKNYCAATGTKHIDFPLLDLICIPDNRGTIFNITDAVSIGDGQSAMTYLHVLFERKEPGPLIIFMLARHFKQLMFALESRTAADLQQKAGVQPFVAKRLLNQVRNFTRPKLEALYGACFETDIAIKTGQIDEQTGIEILIAQASRAALVR